MHQVESLEALYRQWCESGQFSAELEPFEPYDPDELHAETVPAEKANGSIDHRNLLNQIRDETCMMNEDPEHKPTDLVAFELSSVPDAEVLQEVMASRPERGIPETPDAAKKSNNPKTLHAALCFLGSQASTTEVFDQLWRLTMYLRYWGGGADRHWIANPRSSRKALESAQLVSATCLVKIWDILGHI